MEDDFIIPDVSIGVINVTEPFQTSILEILEKGQQKLEERTVELVNTFTATLKTFLLSQPGGRFLFISKSSDGYFKRRYFRCFYIGTEPVWLIGAYICETGNPILICHRAPDTDTSEDIEEGFNAIVSQVQHMSPSGADIGERIVNGMSSAMKADRLREKCIFLETFYQLNPIDLGRIIDNIHQCHSENEKVT